MNQNRIKTLELLAQPFPSRFVKQPPQGKHGSYVPHDIVNQRALAIVGPHSFEIVQVVKGWTDEVVVKRGKPDEHPDSSHPRMVLASRRSEWKDLRPLRGLREQVQRTSSRTSCGVEPTNRASRSVNILPVGSIYLDQKTISENGIPEDDWPHPENGFGNRFSGSRFLSDEKPFRKTEFPDRMLPERKTVFENGIPDT